MLGWIARWRVSGPTSEFLLGEDFETLWAASFRWCNREAPATEPPSIPDDVKQVAYRLIRGFFKGNLNLRTPDGYKAQREPLFFFIRDVNPWRNILWRCIVQGEFDVAYRLSDLNSFIESRRRVSTRRR